MKQLNIYDVFDLKQVQITKPIRLIELFAGYGSQAMALRNIGAEFEHYRVIEIDKYAVDSYNTVHGTSFVPQSICDITASDLGITDKNKYAYIMTYSFPCQDISVAGRGAGFKEGSGTRSSLLWEVKRLLLELDEGGRPDVLLMENVKQLVGKDNMPEFKKWLEFLSSIGYRTTTHILNTSDYGIPQSRERVFAVSTLDMTGDYVHPQPIPLKNTLKDLLETDVDESFYISNEKADQLITELFKRYTTDDFLSVVNAEGDGVPAKSKYKIKRIGTLSENKKNPCPHEGVVYSANGISPAILTQEDYMSLFVENKQIPVDLSIYNPEIKDVFNCVVTKDYGLSNYKNAGNGVLEIKQIGNLFKSDKRDNPSVGRVYSVNGLAPTLTDMCGGHRQPFIVVAMRDGCLNTITSVQKDNLIIEACDLRLRKLTPRECLRLQGVSETDIDKLEKINSRTQLYKQAGNSITVPVLEAIFRQLGITGVERWNDLVVL